MTRVKMVLALGLITLLSLPVAVSADPATIQQNGGFVTADSANDPVTGSGRSLVGRWTQELYGRQDPAAYATLAAINNVNQGSDITDVNWIYSGQQYYLPSQRLFDSIYSQLNGDPSRIDEVMANGGRDAITAEQNGDQTTVDNFIQNGATNGQTAAYTGNTVAAPAGDEIAFDMGGDIIGQDGDAVTRTEGMPPNEDGTVNVGGLLRENMEDLARGSRDVVEPEPNYISPASDEASSSGYWGAICDFFANLF